MDDEILIEVEQVEEEQVEEEQVEEEQVEEEQVEVTPILRAPLSPPVVSEQVTNGFARDVLGYAEDILKGKPDSEYLLYGSSHLSWVLVTSDHFGSVEGGAPCFYGDVSVYHIYQDEYIPNQSYLTWFFDVDYPDTFVPDSDIENYLVYASPSFGDYPRIMGVIEDAQVRYNILWGFAVPFLLLWVVLQQIMRRFG